MKRIAALLVCLSLSSVVSAKPFESFDAKLKDSLAVSETSDPTKVQMLSCKPVGGTAVTVLAQTGVPFLMSQVKINDGSCQGLVGWVTSANLVKAD